MVRKVVQNVPKKNARKFSVRSVCAIEKFENFRGHHVSVIVEFLRSLSCCMRHLDLGARCCFVKLKRLLHTSLFCLHK